MGFFGSSHKTFYSSVTSKLFEDVPGVIKQTTASAIMQNRNIANDLKVNLANGTSAQANRLYNFARHGHFPWGLPNGSFSALSPHTADNVKLIIEKEVGQPIEMTYCAIDTDPDTNHIIYETEYYLKDNRGNIGTEAYLWTYDERTGVHPSLTLKLDDVAPTSPYYPIIPIYENQVSLIAEGQPHRAKIKQACRYLGVDVQQISDSIRQQGLTPEQVEAGDTPDNPVEDAFVVLGVEITNPTQIGQAYLFKYFEHMKGVSTVTEEDYLYWKEHSLAEDGTYYLNDPPFNLVSLADSTYQIELGWLYITDTVVEGTIGSKGTYSVEYVGAGSLSLNSTSSRRVNLSSVILRKQITTTQYIKLEVKGLVYSNWIVGRETRTTLNRAFDDPEGQGEAFIIPLRKDLLKQLGVIKTHDLMHTSIRLVVNDKNRVKLKWYQQSWFQIVIVVVAVVISALGAPEVGAMLLSLEFWIVAVAKIIISRIIMEAGMKMLQDVLGEELAILVQMVAMYYMGAGAVNTAFAGANGAVNLYTAQEMQSIQNEIEEITELTEDLIEEENARLETMAEVRSWLSGDPYNMMQADTYIKMFKYNSKLPTLITATTEHFTDMMKFIDRPSSYIRLGN